MYVDFAESHQNDQQDQIQSPYLGNHISLHLLLLLLESWQHPSTKKLRSQEGNVKKVAETVENHSRKKNGSLIV